MNKTLTALLLALTSAWAVDQNPVVEMYPDDMPKSQLVFTLDLANSREWELCKFPYKVSASVIMSYLFEYIGFESIKIYSDMSVNVQRESKDLFFVKCKNKIAEDTVFVKVIKSVDHKPSQPLERVLYFVNEDVYNTSKWNMPRKVSLYQGKKEYVSEMSWRFIDFALHSKPGLMYTKEFFASSEAEVSIFSDIKSQGLNKVVSRIYITQNENNCYSFYNLYETEQDELKGLSLLSNLREEIIQNVQGSEIL